MYVYEDDTHIGTVEQVVVRRGGSEIHLEQFTSTDIVVKENRRVRKLMLVEVVAFVAEQYPDVLAISIWLNRVIHGQGDAMKLAATRASLLHGMGAEQIKIIPHYEAANAGHFVIDALWKRNTRNLQALAASLQRERELYAATRRRSPLARWGERIQRLLMGGVR